MLDGLKAVAVVPEPSSTISRITLDVKKAPEEFPRGFFSILKQVALSCQNGQQQKTGPGAKISDPKGSIQV